MLSASEEIMVASHAVGSSRELSWCVAGSAINDMDVLLGA